MRLNGDGALGRGNGHAHLRVARCHELVDGCSSGCDCVVSMPDGPGALPSRDRGGKRRQPRIALLALWLCRPATTTALVFHWRRRGLMLHHSEALPARARSRRGADGGDGAAKVANAKVVVVVVLIVGVLAVPLVGRVEAAVVVVPVDVFPACTWGKVEAEGAAEFFELERFEGCRHGGLLVPHRGPA